MGARTHASGQVRVRVRLWGGGQLWPHGIIHGIQGMEDICMNQADHCRGLGRHVQAVGGWLRGECMPQQHSKAVRSSQNSQNVGRKWPLPSPTVGSGPLRVCVWWAWHWI